MERLLQLKVSVYALAINNINDVRPVVLSARDRDWQLSVRDRGWQHEHSVELEGNDLSTKTVVLAFTDVKRAEGASTQIPQNKRSIDKD